MEIVEKIISYVVPTVTTILLLRVWRRSRKGESLGYVGRGVVIVLIIQLLTHLYTVALLAWKIHRQLGYQALPPYNQYFLTDVLSGLQPIIAGAVHAVLWFGLLYFVFLRRGRGTMLDVNDVLLLTIGLLAVGWPAGLVFLALTFVLAVVGMIVLVVLRRKQLSDRLIITPYIIPAAILVLFFGARILAITHLDKIRF